MIQYELFLLLRDDLLTSGIWTMSEDDIDVIQLKTLE